MAPERTTAGPAEPCTCYRNHDAIAAGSWWTELPLLAVERDATGQNETRRCAGGGLIVARKPLSDAKPWRFLSGRKEDFAPTAAVVRISLTPVLAHESARSLSARAQRGCLELDGARACRDITDGSWVVVDLHQEAA